MKAAEKNLVDAVGSMARLGSSFFSFGFVGTMCGCCTEPWTLMGLATMATMATTQRCHEVNEHVNAKELFVGLLVLELATNKWTCKRGATIKIKTPLSLPLLFFFLFFYCSSLLLSFFSFFSLLFFFFFFVSLPEQHVSTRVDKGNCSFRSSKRP